MRKTNVMGRQRDRIKSVNFFLMMLLLVAAPGAAKRLEAQPRKILVAAASDMKYALDSVISNYSSTHKDVNIVVTYGSSGKFFEQISNGAPFDIFFSADVAYPDKLVGLGKTGQAVRKYGRGRIVIWSRRIDPNADGINSLLDKRITKIAIANPEHAPYGRRAVEAMKQANIYEQVKSRLVFGENISQAAQFVTTGAADAGILALSLALSPPMKSQGKYYLIPETFHQPLEQAVVILKQAANNADARTFQDFVLSTRGQAILSYFGFSEPK
ncbi:molybdate ABC transporter substrate-binding protein [Chryseolinea sp. T2]|uniref:molybdate ABC transporter substrate-binding protein n=1 Tax=Chryseolinea sp. T2 TaxID=3129255 RepID=UPI003078022C